MTAAASTRPEVVGAFRRQVEWCASLGSPFTSVLLAEAASDLERDTALSRLIGQWPGDPVADALPLRLAGALHALARSGGDAELESRYPARSGPAGDGVAAWTVARARLERNSDYFREFLTSPPQTNEVGRSGVLLGGFLAVARATALPMRLLEIGSSAGLNLVFDRFFYRFGAGSWGDPSSPVKLAPAWSGPSPAISAPLRVASRQGCDLRPADLEDAAQRFRLRSYIWADQWDRLDRFDGAVALARAENVRVEPADAAAWVRQRLGEPHPGNSTVVFHSIVWQYLPAEAKACIGASLDRAGAAATANAPLAWLRLEPDGPGNPYLKLTLWPCGETSTLARAHFHGASIEWMPGQSA
jgi:hypothetical protein